jgi:hypothetical protein
MESPFDKYQNKTVILYLEPLLDSYHQTYINALTMNVKPDGPIANMVKPYNAPALSPFQTFTNNITTPFQNCTYVLTRYPNQNSNNSNRICKQNWMTAEDIPAVLSYLQDNQYHVETSLTKLIQRSDINLGGVSDTKISGNRRMICMFSYYPIK